MAKDKVELELVLKRISDLEKVQGSLNDSTKAAKALQKQFEAINTQIVSLASQTNAYMKKFDSLVKGASNLGVARLARQRQDEAVKEAAGIDKQIAAQRIRYSQALLDNERLYGAAKKSHMATTQRELAALNNLLQQKKNVIEAERQSENANKRILTIQERINQSVSKYRIARQLGTSGSIDGREDQLKRASLLIDRQRLLVDQARLKANGVYTAELARQENRLGRLLQMQRQIQNTPQAPQQRIIQPVEPASLFRVQAQLLVNYALMNQFFTLFSFGSSYVAQFDNALKDFQAITETTNTEIKGLGDTFVDVSKKTKFSAVEVAEAAVIMGQAGFSSQQVNKSIEAVALLATATGSNLSEAVDVATSAITVFNLTASETAHVADVMTGALNLSKLTMQKLQLGIQYAGNTAASMGITLEELTASLGAMSNAGIKSGSTLGTGLTQMLINLQSPTRKMREELAKVGLTLADVDVKARGLTNVIETLNESGFNSSNAFKAFEVRAARAYLALAANVDSAKDYEEALLLTSAAQEANNIQMESLSNSLKKLRNNFGALILEIGEPIKNALIVVADTLSYLLEKISKASTAAGVLGIALASLGTAAVITRIGVIIGGLTGLTGALTTAGVAAAGASTKIGFLTAAITALFRTPLGLLTLAIAGLITLFSSFGSSSRKVSEELDKIQASVDKSTGALNEAKDRMSSVDSELARLIDRYTELSNNNEALEKEVLSVKARFGEFSESLATDSINTIEDLIKSLRTLRGELAQFQLSEASAALAESSEGIRKRIEVTIDASRTYYRRANISRGLRGFNSGSFISENSLPSNLSRFEDFDADFSSPQERSEFRKAITDELNKTSASIVKLTKYKKKLVDDAKRDNKVLDDEIEDIDKRRDEAKAYKDVLKTLYTKLADTSRLKDIQAQAAVSSSIAAQKQLEEIGNIEAEISQKEAELRKAKTNAQKRILKKELSDLKTKAEKYNAALVSPDSPVISSIANETGLSQGDAAAAANKLLSDRLAAAAQTAGSAIEKVSDSLGDGTVEFFDKFTELTKLKITEIERRLKHVGDDIDSRIAILDATISEVTDRERGGLRGSYSDAEVSIFEDRKKELTNQGLREQIVLYKELSGTIDELVEHQKKLYLASVQQYDDAKGTKGEGRALKSMVEANKDYNDAVEKQTKLRNDAQKASIELAAAMGEETEAHVTLGDQIVYSISKYYDQLKIQNDLRLNVQRNVIDIMDTASDSFGDFVKEVSKGTKSVGQSFRDMASRIIEAMLDIAAKSLATQAMGGLGGLFGNIFGSVFGGLSQSIGFATSPAGTYGPFQSGLPFATGGSVPRRYDSGGGAVSTRDSVHALLRPDEFVLRKSAVDMIGRKNLEHINAMGNRRVSSSSATLSSISGSQSDQLGTPVNVYVVAPEHKPSLTKNDVLAIVSDDIYKSGTTAKLIKTVIAGKK